MIRHSIIWVDNGIAYRKIKDGSNIFHAVMVPQTLQPCILYKSHNVLGHNGSTRLYNFIKRYYFQRKLCQHCNKYVGSCPECQQVTLKEPQYINTHLSIPQFPMSFISMDLLVPYSEIEKGEHI